MAGLLIVGIILFVLLLVIAKCAVELYFKLAWPYNLNDYWGKESRYSIISVLEVAERLNVPCIYRKNKMLFRNRSDMVTIALAYDE